MRLWSLHPEYLDTKGLLALWREALLAKHVLEGKTKGYKNHPQLIRFKNSSDPVSAINYYLTIVAEEADRRGYRFDKTKIVLPTQAVEIKVTSGQVEYERAHLSRKLGIRAPQLQIKVDNTSVMRLHPIFTITEGPIAHWEII